jgi:site-specific recombinase XerD
MIEEAIKKWQKYTRRNYSPQTCDLYNYVLKLYSSQNGTNITTESIESFLDDILQNYSRSTFNTYLTAMRSFCKYQNIQLGATENYAKPIPYLKEVNYKQRIVTETEYAKILANVRQGTEKHIIEFLANTGIRRQEFFDLCWEQIAEDLKSMRILGKGRKYRVVPLNDTCREILQVYGRQPGRVQFTMRYGSLRGLNYLCRKTARKAKIPRFSPHSLRHYFCTMLVKKGVSIYLVSRILGHASVLVTQRIYCHLQDGDILGMTDCLCN